MMMMTKITICKIFTIWNNKSRFHRDSIWDRLDHAKLWTSLHFISASRTHIVKCNINNTRSVQCENRPYAVCPELLAVLPNCCFRNLTHQIFVVSFTVRRWRFYSNSKISAC